MSAPAKPRSAIYAPPGFPLREYLGRLNHGGLSARSGSYRRAVCEMDPLCFALTYFPHHLRAPETGGELSFSQFHVDMAEAAKRWASPDLGPAEVRDAWIAPRGAGKSTFSFLLLPAWAMAFGHRKLVAAYAHNSSQTRRHLSNLKREFETNELLRADFPDLVRPATRRGGGTVADTQESYFASSGVAMMAHGIDSQTLGTKVGSQRPDLILCHRIGTLMQHHDEWIPVEQHPSFTTARECASKVVRVWGLPFEEVVTPEHRYWTKWLNGRRATYREQAWCEAGELEREHYIGTPIDMTVDSAATWTVKRKIDGANRDDRGRIYGPVWEEQQDRPACFDDPEFWWLVGYWWGNGHLGSTKDSGGNYATVGVTIPHKRPELVERLRGAVGKQLMVSARTGCSQYMWSNAALARWLRTWKQPGIAHKTPPAFVERLPFHLQRALVEGYANADGDETKPHEVRVASVWLPGLLALRRIQARLGVAVTVRKGPAPRLEIFPGGHMSVSQQKYDARWSLQQDRYKFNRTHIADGFLWNKIRSVEDGPVEKFAPIRTATGTYLTDFGLSHNCDDIEPDASNYSAAQKEKRLDTIRNAILGMNDRAVVQLVGTVTMTGSIMHDLVQAHLGKTVDWVREEKIRTRYYPPFVPGLDGEPVSMWPQRWSTEYLRSIEHTRSFQLNFLNQPVNPGGTYWQRSDFSYDVPRQIDERVLAVDPAVSRNDSSDDTGLAVVGYSVVARKVVVEYAAGVRMSPAELRDRVHQLCRANPTIRTVLVEGNQGGDVWESVFEPLPGGVRLRKVHHHSSKAERFAKVHDLYQRGLVSHLRPHEALEEQMCSFPKGGVKDDIVDSVCVAVDFFLGDRPKAAAFR